MKNSSPVKPTEAELEILQVLWQRDVATVREVHEQLATNRRAVGYTTTLKNMQNMVQKGLLQRDDSQRSHVYRAVVQQDKTQRLLLDRFLNTAFGGSASRLVMQALGHQKTTAAERQQIKDLIDQIENKKS